MKSDALKKIKIDNDESNKRTDRLLALINLSINIKKKNPMSFLRTLIRKWKYITFSKKLVRQKMLKMYEIVQKS